MCDMTSPTCHQCEKDAIACSGYGSTKPVTFLPIGARSRQKGRDDLKVRHPIGLPSLPSVDAAHAPSPRDLVIRQDTYFVNAAKFCTSGSACVQEVECESLTSVPIHSE